MITNFEDFINENKIEPYKYTKYENVIYSFNSTGKKDILKVIEFQKIENEYNLAFGDALYDNENNIIGYDDTSMSDNGDFDKIISTLVTIIYDFSKIFKNYIQFTGSSDKRTKIYNYLIKRYYDIFVIDFEIYGIINDNIEMFDTNKNYDIIKIKRK